MEVIPVRPLASQQLSVTLSNQATRLQLTQRPTGLYADVYVNDALLLGGVICENANPLVRGAYLGFVGDLTFWDLEGASDPEYSGLGSRYVLVYTP